MGLVKVDVKRAERPFELLSFSDIDCIKGLIKNRCIIDPYFQAEKDNNYNFANIVKPMNQELIVIYIDLDRLIDEANLNVKQRFIVNKFMEGYTVEEIAGMFPCEERNITSHLDKVCNKIKEINERKWLYDYIYMNYVMPPFDFKKCSRCEKTKPAVNEFFSLNKSSKDGLHSICKDCR